ncbi:MAG: HAD family phosphatase [Candidatus Diapherotrites archaeon]|uniref:HAD family phosphatase n=1 Tax=Candidatus Iainarchaeum sp. TaxID=3101447 RepID=A0A8T4LES2_9ARCH|nr:HAD family phosphatase [Candidatus Diapherotrites archaeon]
MHAQKAAIFDIDGVLVKGFIICEFPKYLDQQGCIGSESNKKIQLLLSEYIKGTKSAAEVATELPQVFARGLKGCDHQKVEKLGAAFMAIYKKNIFEHSKQLVKLMKQKGYLVLAMSGSPIEVIKQLKYLGFDDLYGTECEIVDGVYSGNVKTNLVIRENKETLFYALIKKYNIDIESSFGFGDTSQDLPVLEHVGHPVTVNPDKKLSEIAEQRKWPIVKNKTDIRGLLDF